ncbi:MAG: hypothetical protein ACRD2W_17000 [Acidimicrobiales bacterium]
MSDTTAMDEIYLKLIQGAGVPAEAQKATVSRLRALKREYPNETPARLFARARKEGAAIPPSRCPHGVVRGDCVSCDSKIGARRYFTAGGSHLHTRPTCDALRSGEEKGVLIEAIRVDAALGDGRAACEACATVAPRRAATTRPRAAKVVARPVFVPGRGPVPLDQSKPPAVGDQIEWSGYAGEITEVTDRGVHFFVDGITLAAPWGDRARVKRAPA